MKPVAIPILCLTLCLCSVLSAQVSQQDKARIESVLKGSKRGGKDTFQLIDQLTKDVPVTRAVSRLNMACSYLYQQKQVTQMLMLGRAGIQFGLQAAKAEKDQGRARQIRSLVKAMSFNVAANAWPGWGDQGRQSTSSNLADGLDLARLNLRLAKELKRKAFPLGNAHWLVGAHLLAARQYDATAEPFRLAKAHFKKAKKPDFAAMVAGYEAIAAAAKARQGKSVEKDQRVIAAAAELKKRQTPDAKYFAKQIMTAAKVLFR